MTFFEAHKPYILSFFLAATSSYLLLPTFAGFLGLWVVYCPLTALLMPDGWVRAIPTPDQEAEAVIIFGFGYIINGPDILPGAADKFMVEWVIKNRPEIKTVLAQEGSYPEYMQRRQESKLADDLKVINIHQYYAGVYVNSMDVAKMAIPIMRSEGIKRILVVAHHLQLKRAAGDIEKVMKKMDFEATVVVPDLPDVPYPHDSSQWHTCYKWRYKMVELLLSRPRDWHNAGNCGLF